jgi:hypothetical protein
MKNNEAITQQQIFNRGNLEHYRMPRTKVEAFFAEFPWVEKYASGPIDQVYVSRFTPELTKYVPQEYKGTYYYDESIYFLDENGLQVDLVQEVKYMARKYIFFGHRVEKSSPCLVKGVIHNADCSVFTRLQSLEEKGKSVRFLVSYFFKTQALIVYKVPAGVTLPVWINQQIKAEQTGFKDQCQAIDAEAGAK